LIDAVARVRADRARREDDQFALKADLTDLEGKPFSFTGPAETTYKDGGLEASFSFGTFPSYRVRPDWPGTDLRYLTLRTTRTPLGTYRGSNAFGAQVTVSDSKTESDLLLINKKPSGSALSSLGEDRYVGKLALPAAEAKALSSRLIFKVSGTLASHSGELGGCFVDGKSATLDAPTSRIDRYCFVGGKVSAVQLIDTGNGAILQEWSDALDEEAEAKAIAEKQAALRHAELNREAVVTRRPGFQIPYPKRAARMEQEGYATVTCESDSTGSLSDCLIVEERPVGSGFGEALMAARNQFVVTPKMVDGVNVPSRVPLSMRFRLE
jgi:TonB family protein